MLNGAPVSSAITISFPLICIRTIFFPCFPDVLNLLQWRCTCTCSFSSASESMIWFVLDLHIFLVCPNLPLKKTFLILKFAVLPKMLATTAVARVYLRVSRCISWFLSYWWISNFVSRFWLDCCPAEYRLWSIYYPHGSMRKFSGTSNFVSICQSYRLFRNNLATYTARLQSKKHLLR